MSRLLPATRIAEAYREACRLDVAALKPGNVHTTAAGHGMEVRHFLASARVTAPIVADATLAIGTAIRRAVEATFREVGCNTNLGILLLAQPIAAAAGRDLPPPGMGDRVGLVLAGLDHEDACQVYAAIAHANPGGLGRVEGPADVRASPPADWTLMDAMRAARHRDLVAEQFATGFVQVFDLCQREFRPLLIRGLSKEEAVSRLYLGQLARRTDTHIARKSGEATAVAVRRRAASVNAALRDHPSWLEPGAVAELVAFDTELKAQGLNPGSLADMMVAVAFLSEILVDTGVPAQGS